jgi:hypothetical protein
MLKHQHRVYSEEILQREGASQSQNPTAAYRLGVDIGEGSGWGSLAGWENFFRG